MSCNSPSVIVALHCLWTSLTKHFPQSIRCLSLNIGLSWSSFSYWSGVVFRSLHAFGLQTLGIGCPCWSYFCGCYYGRIYM